MWFFRLSLLLVGTLALKHHTETTIEENEVSGVIHDTEVVLKWATDFEQQNVLFSVTFSNDRLNWVGIGFSDHGMFNNSDLCVFRNGKLKDYFIGDAYRLELDRGQDCELVNVKYDGFEFRRKFSTCDPKDYAIEPGTTQFIIAGGDKFTLKFDRKDVVKAFHYGQLIHSNPPTPELESDRQDFEVLAVKAKVPAQVTTYWCVIKELSEEIRARKHHIIMLNAAVQAGNEHLVHHMEVFQCQANDQTEYSGDCSDSRMPAASKSCSHVIAAWSMGEGPVYYPPEAGLPIGGNNGKSFLKVEIHYNNVPKTAGIEDNSGFHFVVTPSLRKYDAAIMELGNIYSDALSIPPGQDAFTLTGYCVADCLSKLPSSGITVFASQLHAHLTGRKLWTSHYRNGVKIGELNRDNHYSPHWQHSQAVPKVHVKQGDVLATNCVHETRSRGGMTLGGYGIEDEMCVNYIYYYPASEVEVCKSSIDNSTLHRYFKTRYGIPDNGKLRIDEKYKKIDWTAKNLLSLKELYSTAPLNMHCYQQDGTLFPNHRSNWTGIPLPPMYAGPFIKQRDHFECPALNDY